MSRRFLVTAALLVSSLVLLNCASKKTSHPPVAHVTEPSDTKIDTVAARKHKFPFLEDSDKEDRWVDSIYARMDFSEKAGQLFMVAAYSNRDSAHVNSVERLVRDQKIGGIIFFQGGPGRQAALTNRYQAAARIPLFVGIDAEWGVSMRLDSTYRFPFNMTLGAIRDKRLLEEVGAQMGKESRRLGVQFNFAPVLDINTNPKNPIIGFRSFGEDRHNVTESALALMKGVQNQRVFSTGKHFPGHGDTETDSHYALPVVNASKARLEEVELVPYRKLISEGLASVMVAHLNVPSIDARPGYPSSLSDQVVTGLLRTEMGFDGLIFTDALNMKAAANARKKGEVDLDAFLAGNDMLLFPENVPVALEKLCVAYQDSIITEERLARSVKKILHYKYKAGLNHYRPVALTNLTDELNPAENIALQYRLYENAVTVVRNVSETVPIGDLSRERIAYVKMGDDDNSTFLSTLRKYAQVEEVSHTDIDTLNQKLKSFSRVIVGYHKSDKPWKKHDFSETELQRLRAIARENHVILDVFVKPYALLPVDFFNEIETVIVSYQNADIAQEVSAEIIFGAVGAKGRLPVSIGTTFKVGDGIDTKSTDRLGFTAPENVGMRTATLAQIDTEAQKAIDTKAAPGMQILVARNGKVVYHKAFGYQTYEPECKIQLTDVYDVASMTKILATLPLVMQEYDKGNIQATTTLGDMLPLFRHTDKAAISFTDLLSHYAGLEAWIPFYKSTLNASGFPDDAYYRKVPEDGFTRQVADSLYIRNDYNQNILQQIIASKLSGKREYKYSDFTFIILKEYVERAMGKPIDVLVKDRLYSHLGANSTGYNPLSHFPKTVIAPTEDDTYFRHQRIQGYVHDMAAAMQGGVAGHAGLFSNAMDVAKIMQMYLWKGHYGGTRFFSAATFDAFNTCHFCAEGNRRGWGFDKPQLPGTAGPTCNCVSPSSFGHTGFTGTMTWADPESGLLYVFLSNRTFPDSNAPNKLSKDNVRERIQKIIQDAVVRP
ncbi:MULTISPECIES: glycoside hydrolase family 3 N-terminal domain-containing protein [unclassified Flavobacterium]|uniref:glycoside hydrolase family 3 N-terminal domain-containing protein n=1 Tax=unclassified Flavobacterium TaxID=196869 RepID=UPI001F1382D7|nr:MULTISPECIES: glycoside hydrolase family 3 N-terminal domain-containing protein [unclassified Flavobacterium]UMY65054.1 serine hydrolase [Flavobacterium sp. HJ-32-4]